MIAVIIVLIIISVVTVFSVQNALPVIITFLFWKFEASLAIILFLSVLAGAVIGVSAASFFRMKSSPKKQHSTD
ncbi:MAG: LapA family protein [Nitrospiraceae bacterium]|nr:MAG: LapA family protein [Nitrospiraceae bacterium]